MGEVISMSEYLEHRTEPSQEAIKKRIADIALEILLLGSERNQLIKQLNKPEHL